VLEGVAAPPVESGDPEVTAALMELSPNDREALVLLSHLSPRRMTRVAEQSVAAAVTCQRQRISEHDLQRNGSKAQQQSSSASIG